MLQIAFIAKIQRKGAEIEASVIGRFIFISVKEKWTYFNGKHSFVDGESYQYKVFVLGDNSNL